MVWHSARNGGTEMPDCGVIVNADRSFVGLSNDDYIRSQSEAQLAKLLALNFADVKIGLFEPRSSLGKQRSLHYIYTGVLDGKKQTSLGFQTIYRQRLYTFFCNATADEFSYLYADLLAIADSLSFK